MIPAQPGTLAHYKYVDGKERDLDFFNLAVVAYSDDGRALVHRYEADGLCPASELAGVPGAEFVCIFDPPELPDIIAVMPANGWRVALAGTDPQERSWPVLGWALNRRGETQAILPDAIITPGELTGSIWPKGFFTGNDGLRLFRRTETPEGRSVAGA